MAPPHPLRVLQPISPILGSNIFHLKKRYKVSILRQTSALLCEAGPAFTGAQEGLFLGVEAQDNAGLHERFQCRPGVTYYSGDTMRFAIYAFGFSMLFLLTACTTTYCAGSY